VPFLFSSVGNRALSTTVKLPEKWLRFQSLRRICTTIYTSKADWRCDGGWSEPLFHAYTTINNNTNNNTNNQAELHELQFAHLEYTEAAEAAVAIVGKPRRRRRPG